MRVALVPLSGIRVCDAELLQLGLTLPGFVERSKTIASLPSLGLLTLAGMTPPEHELHYIEMPDLDRADTLRSGFDLVAISSYSAQIFEAYELAERCRSRGTPVVMGGPHVSCLPDEALRHCDAVVVGEGELGWPRVLADCAQHRLDGIYGIREREFDLRNAPLPALELLDLSRYNRLTVQSSRGCPHRCEFCASSVLLGGRYRSKPMEHVLRELRAIRRRWRRPFIEFADDNALVHKAHWKKLLAVMPQLEVRWFAETDISVGDDDELLDLMREAGCAQVLIGLESPERRDLAGLELRTDWKFERHADYKAAIRRIQSRGIAVNGCFVLGLDGQGPEIFDEVRRFVEDTELYDVQVTLLTPFPGTPLHDRLEREGRLTHPGRWDRCTLFDVNFEPLGMTAAQLTEGFRSLVVELYGEEFTRWRRRRFASRLRALDRRRKRSRNEEPTSPVGAVRDRRDL